MEPVDFALAKAKLPKIIDDMWETCVSVSGAGISACQVGLDMQLAVLVARQPDDSLKRIVIINPVIIAKTGKIIAEEGCLSLPGLFADVERAEKIVIRALNEKGVPVEITASGFMAKLFQHEIDHLSGAVFTDRVVPAEKTRVKQEIKRLKKHWAAIDESKKIPNYENGFPWDA